MDERTDQQREQFPSTPQSGDVGLRELALRLLTGSLRRPGGGPPEQVQLLPGVLPADLPFDLPLPSGARIVGTFSDARATVVLLDTDLQPQRVLAFYREQLLSNGWTEREAPGSQHMHGFVDTRPGQWVEPLTLSFSKEAGALLVEVPRAASGSGQSAAGGGLPTEVQLTYYTEAPVQYRLAPKLPEGTRPPRPHHLNAARYAPQLVPPPGAQQRGGGSGGSDSEWRTTGRLQSDLDLAAIALHYDQQLEQAEGWKRLGGEVSGGVTAMTAWSAWDVANEDDEPWRGLFLALRWPEAPGVYLLELHVLWAGGEPGAFMSL